ncbi:MAG: phosphoribosylaminoimidazolesuccinocarboxamide synthase [Candidatus Omnitrophota bacterium]|nr:phosphoribosylaminoimidazolesuccinocarboxamide synthase [Candidatus Omnitrophota bacterium]
MEKTIKIYEGKAKIVFETVAPDLLIQYFKDDATAFDATKKGTIKDKGIMNNKISSRLFQILEKEGIPTHFVKILNEREMLIKRVVIIPVEVTIRNIVAGGMSRALGLEEGLKLDCPVLEYHLKNDSLHDPLINEYHIKALKIASLTEIETIKNYSFKVNEILTRFFSSINLDLIDFKLEFGRFKDEEIILADEISPDTCRLWEKTTGKRLDKDRFRRDLGNIEEAYQEVLRRVSK